MVDVLNYLKQQKNSLVGSSTAKIELCRAHGAEGPLLASIVGYVNLSAPVHASVASSSNVDVTTLIRIEAANVIVSLAHGPREVLLALLNANAPRTVLSALVGLSDHDPNNLKLAVTRAFRALTVAIADCAGLALWGLADECLEYKSDIRSTLDFLFQPQALDAYLPLLEHPSSAIRLVIAQLIANAVRVSKHRIAITEWLPLEDRWKDSKGKRGWEVSALVDANSPERQGGWTVRHLTTMLGVKDFSMQEVSLCAIAALVRDNPNVALVLSKAPPDQKSIQSVLSIASDLSRDRRPELQLAASLCVTNILRSTNSSHNRRLSSTTIHVLSAIIADDHGSPVNRMKACHILSWLVADDNDRCLDAWKSGALAKLANIISKITPELKPQEWEDGEATDISLLREAALIGIASLSLVEDNIRNEVAGVLGLLPRIAVCLTHPLPRVRYGACQCVRALSRTVRVLRTSLLDSGVGMTICDIVENPDEDRRVTNIGLAALCNLLNDCSPMRKTILDRGMLARITILAHSSEDTMRVNALWAVKNLLYKAPDKEKETITGQIGWDYLKS